MVFFVQSGGAYNGLEGDINCADISAIPSGYLAVTTYLCANAVLLKISRFEKGSFVGVTRIEVFGSATTGKLLPSEQLKKVKSIDG